MLQGWVAPLAKVTSFLLTSATILRRVLHPNKTHFCVIQDWEKIRQQNESENRDEIRAMYKLREQEIISQLMQLESKQYDMVSDTAQHST